jgi:hypothetical protein
LYIIFTKLSGVVYPSYSNTFPLLQFVKINLVVAIWHGYFFDIRCIVVDVGIEPEPPKYTRRIEADDDDGDDDDDNEDEGYGEEDVLAMKSRRSRSSTTTNNRSASVGSNNSSNNSNTNKRSRSTSRQRQNSIDVKHEDGTYDDNDSANNIADDNTNNDSDEYGSTRGGGQSNTSGAQQQHTIPMNPKLDMQAKFAANLLHLNGVELGFVISKLEKNCPNALERSESGKMSVPENLEIIIDSIDPDTFHSLAQYALEKATIRKKLRIQSAIAAANAGSATLLSSSSASSFPSIATTSNTTTSTTTGILSSLNTENIDGSLPTSTSVLERLHESTPPPPTQQQQQQKHTNTNISTSTVNNNDDPSPDAPILSSSLGPIKKKRKR